jgi:hypothetical protein
MTRADLLAVLALVVSCISLYVNTRLQRRVTRAEEVQAAVAKREMAEMDRTARKRREADIRLSWEPVSNAYRLVFTNKGEGVAKNVNARTDHPR